MFSDVSIQLRHFILPTFCLLLAMLSSDISNSLSQFQQNDRRRGVRADRHGVIVMYSIDSALNTIWRSKRARPKFTRLPCTG